MFSTSNVTTSLPPHLGDALEDWESWLVLRALEDVVVSSLEVREVRLMSRPCREVVGRVAEIVQGN